MGPMSVIDLVVFGAGWVAGWLLLWRQRPLPPIAALEDRHLQRRRAVAVVVPARNEERSIADVADLVRPQLRPGDELVVVDDHSDDDTARLADEHGARVLMVAPPTGWLGKPYACWQGAQATTAPILLFLDADVRPAQDLLARVAAEVERAPGAVISIQPWHRTERWYEQASVLFNVVALMGSGAFTAGRRCRPAQVAFGPVLGLERTTYDRIGGHAAVRAMHTEDIGLARLAGGATLFTGGPDTSFRMYPGGPGELVAGWTRSIATGLGATRWLTAIATFWWIAALAGGWLAAGWPTNAPLASAAVYTACAAQCWVLGRRAGSFGLGTALLYPVTVVVFVVVVVRSVVIRLSRRQVWWKGRRVDARST